MRTQVAQYILHLIQEASPWRVIPFWFIDLWQSWIVTWLEPIMDSNITFQKHAIQLTIKKIPGRYCSHKKSQGPIKSKITGMYIINWDRKMLLFLFPRYCNAVLMIELLLKGCWECTGVQSTHTLWYCLFANQASAGNEQHFFYAANIIIAISV